MLGVWGVRVVIARATEASDLKMTKVCATAVVRETRTHPALKRSTRAVCFCRLVVMRNLDLAKPHPTPHLPSHSLPRPYMVRRSTKKMELTTERRPVAERPIPVLFDTGSAKTRHISLRPLRHSIVRRSDKDTSKKYKDGARSSCRRRRSLRRRASSLVLLRACPVCMS